MLSIETPSHAVNRGAKARYRSGILRCRLEGTVPATGSKRAGAGASRAARTATVRTSGSLREVTMSRSDDLDAEFPLGDGTVDTSGEVYCPYCGQLNVVALDPGGGSDQEYVEDCQVCCRPWTVRVRYLPDGSADVALELE
jgi:hypothetical protein